jgi:hypothetical protein
MKSKQCYKKIRQVSFYKAIIIHSVDRLNRRLEVAEDRIGHRKIILTNYLKCSTEKLQR